MTDAQKRANRKWDAENTLMLGYKARRDYATRCKEAAAAAGTTVSAVIHDALDALLERYDTGDSSDDA